MALPPPYVFVRWLKEDRVAEALHQRRQAPVAVKLVSDPAAFAHEVATLYALRGPEAAAFVVAIEEEFPAAAAAGSPGLIVLERLGKSLPEYLSKPKERAVVQAVAKSVCFALAALHQAGFAHLDFKPHQVCLVDNENTAVKLVDFDAAKRPGEPCSPAITYMYAAPERFDPAARASFKMDVFCLGLVLVYVLGPHHAPVYLDDTDAKARLKGNVTPMVPEPVFQRFVHPELVGLLRELLQEDPALRPDMATVVRKPIIATGGFTAVGQAADLGAAVDVVVGAVDGAAERLAKQVHGLGPG